MTRTTPRPAPSADYVLLATGQIDPFVPPMPATAPADVVAGAPAARRRTPYMYSCRLGGRR